MSKRIIILFFLLVLTACLATPAPAGTYDVTENGAIGDGRTLDTAAINKTIESAAADGGGTVFFPPGRYLSYSIHLKSNITLYIFEVGYKDEDTRPAFVLEDVRGADFSHVRAQHAAGVPIFVLKNVEDFSTHQCDGLQDTQLEEAEDRNF